MNGEPKGKSLTTADLAAATEIPKAQREINRDREEPAIRNQNPDVTSEEGQLAPLFLPDELVAQVMKSLAETFSNERAKLEAQVDQTDKASTENLRLGLRRYRSFSERLLSL